MEFLMEFFGGIIETILGERLNNKKQILCIGINVSLLICFIVLTIVLFWQGYYLKGTVLAQMYERGEFRALDMDEYVNIVCDQLELLPAEIVIQRVTGDGAKDDLVAPLWSLKKFCVMNEIDKKMGRRNSWQGKALSE